MRSPVGKVRGSKEHLAPQRLAEAAVFQKLPDDYSQVLSVPLGDTDLLRSGDRCEFLADAEVEVGLAVLGRTVLYIMSYCRRFILYSDGTGTALLHCTNVKAVWVLSYMRQISCHLVYSSVNLLTK